MKKSDFGECLVVVIYIPIAVFLTKFAKVKTITKIYATLKIF